VRDWKSSQDWTGRCISVSGSGVYEARCGLLTTHTFARHCKYQIDFPNLREARACVTSILKRPMAPDTFGGVRLTLCAAIRASCRP
jgi:hypothetical protein